MKKLISAAAAFLLLPSVYACADEALVFSLRQKTGAAANGDILIEAEVTENPGVQSWVMILGYDSEKVEFRDYADGVFPGAGFRDDPSAGEVEINFFGGGDISAKGTAFTVSFSPKDGAEDCTFTLKPSDDKDNFFNFAGEDIVCRVERGRLSFKAEAKDSGKQTSAPQPEAGTGNADAPGTAEQPVPEEVTTEAPESAPVSENAGDNAAAPPESSAAETAPPQSAQEDTPPPEPSLDAAVQNAQPEDSAPAENSSAKEESASPETGGKATLAALLLTLSVSGIFAASRRK